MHGETSDYLITSKLAKVSYSYMHADNHSHACNSLVATLLCKVAIYIIAIYSMWLYIAKAIYRYAIYSYIAN